MKLIKSFEQKIEEAKYDAEGMGCIIRDYDKYFHSKKSKYLAFIGMMLIVVSFGILYGIIIAGGF